MKALLYRLLYAIAEFSKRATVPRSTYLTDSDGSPMTDSAHEILTQ